MGSDIERENERIETALSDVQGEVGRLIVAGEDIEALAGRASFEGAVFQLWTAAGLTGCDEAELRVRLGRARERVGAALETSPALQAALRLHDGMDALRSALAAQVAESDGQAGSVEPELELACHLVAATGVCAAAWYRLRVGLGPLAPDATATHAADVYRLMIGAQDSAQDSARARAFQRYLVTVLEHGLNASAYAARVVASTGSDAVSAVVAGIGALKGPLHGGAPGPVLDMLDAIGGAERAAGWLTSELGAGRRIMGMGHRIYRQRDPRAAVLEDAIVALQGSGVRTNRLVLARAVEHAARHVLREKYPERALDTNVEFYTAVLLDALGIERRGFTPVFALARVAGWLAHIAEQRRRGRLIRPQATYLGRA